MPCTRPNQRKAALARGEHRSAVGLSSDVKSTFHFGIERIYPAQTVPSRRSGQPISVHPTRPAIVAIRCAGLAELADATVSKTVVRKDVWVRVPHSALAFGCPLLAESARRGRSSFLLGVQPPGPARRGFAPEPPDVRGYVGLESCDSGWAYRPLLSGLARVPDSSADVWGGASPCRPRSTGCVRSGSEHARHGSRSSPPRLAKVVAGVTAHLGTQFSVRRRQSRWDRTTPTTLPMF